ncbi:hypothetical protein BP6252_07561 [Coleophoma cylindrospora]|uniref:PNPLA domain-containing protein n=1 Tax=Coleophoma cylindrospora TaxID=1849047 RepID=A0A3D8RAQ3_9HELO|nr:hypothetical protein BP6252_07561 [Coleophoma cylindrospora]
MDTPQPGRPKRILSLEGSGICGLSTILILKRLMRLYNEGTDEAAERTGKEPWQVFDMICGTSTGGIIAIMLGRLQMPLDECEEAYLSLVEKLFSPQHSKQSPLRGYGYFNANGKVDHKSLEDAIRFELKMVAERKRPARQTEMQGACSEFVGSSNKSSQPQKVKKTRTKLGKWLKTFSKQKAEGAELQNILLWDQDSECNVFVCTVCQKSSTPTALRSYPAEDNMDSIHKICKVWEAVRATVAAPAFFDPISIGKYGEILIDGGLKEHNPIARAKSGAKSEACSVWMGQELVITSIGTGTTRIECFEGTLINVANRLKEIATDWDGTWDGTWETFARDNRAMLDEDCLFRFAATDLEDVALGEAGEKDAIADRTNGYLQNWFTKKKLRNCKMALLGHRVSAVKHAETTSDRLGMGLSNITFKRNLNFVQRDHIFQEIEEKLSSRGPCRNVTLCGYDKSEIAREYVLGRREESPGCSIFWLPADSVDTFERAYLQVGRLLKIPGLSNKDADAKSLVQNKLSDERSGEWLIIVDNADDAEVLFKPMGPGTKTLFEYLPSSLKGSIIFNTRRPEVAVRLVPTRHNRIEIPKMSHLEATELVRKLRGEEFVLENSEAVDRILIELDYDHGMIAYFIAYSDVLRLFQI